MAELLIKAVTAANLEQVLPLIADYQRFYQVPRIDEARNRQFFVQFAQHSECGIQHLALVEGKAAGFSTLYFSYCSLKAAPVAILYDLYVVPELRRQGIARALMDNAVAVARQQGMQQLQWYTDPDNRSARNLYDDLGAKAGLWVQYTLDLDAVSSPPRGT